MSAASPSPALKNRACLCGNRRCAQLMQDMNCFAAARCKWIKLPRASDRDTAAGKANNKAREVFLTHLGPAARAKAADTSYKTDHYFASIHVHPAVWALCTEDGRGTRLPEEVPSLVAEQVREGGVSAQEQSILLFRYRFFNKSVQKNTKHKKSFRSSISLAQPIENSYAHL